MIKKDCDDEKYGDDYTYSSMIGEVNRTNFRLLLFFYEKILQA